MHRREFEKLLDRVTSVLDEEAKSHPFESASDFESRARALLLEVSGGMLEIDLHPHPHVFPDIELGSRGIEVKFTKGASWRSVANSILESSRSENVEEVYLLYGKMGGDLPGVRWGRYEDCVVHVRTSHALRFEVEIPAESTLFDQLGISYDEFRAMPLEGKMTHIRSYARSRLKPGERLWWLPPQEDQEHSLPIQARLYMTLSQSEKRQLRAEAALLCPQVVKPSRAKHKYDDAVLYLLTYHGVLCPQARDLFSAGSVALRGSSIRGGNYVQRALIDIESEIIDAARRLEDALFEEYWGKVVPPAERIPCWLSMADEFAQDWCPSKVLFGGTF